MIPSRTYRPSFQMLRRLEMAPEKPNLHNAWLMSIQNVNDGLWVFLPRFITFFMSYDLPQFENSLRRHNYVGMIHSLALALAKAGRLDAAVDGARTAMRKRFEERRKKRQPMDED
jgi:Ubiquitin carboxyl-terminal hydrolases